MRRVLALLAGVAWLLASATVCSAESTVYEVGNVRCALPDGWIVDGATDAQMQCHNGDDIVLLYSYNCGFLIEDALLAGIGPHLMNAAGFTGDSLAGLEQLEFDGTQALRGDSLVLELDDATLYGSALFFMDNATCNYVMLLRSDEDSSTEEAFDQFLSCVSVQTADEVDSDVDESRRVPPPDDAEALFGTDRFSYFELGSLVYAVPESWNDAVVSAEQAMHYAVSDDSSGSVSLVPLFSVDIYAQDRVMTDATLPDYASQWTDSVSDTLRLTTERLFGRDAICKEGTFSLNGRTTCGFITYAGNELYLISFETDDAENAARQYRVLLDMMRLDGAPASEE